MKLQFGELVLIRMEFHQKAGGRSGQRWSCLTPATTISSVPQLRPNQEHSEFDIGIQQWRAAGLNIASFVRIHKLTVLAKSEIVRQLGTLARRRTAMRSVT